jgi:hypothetical protein
MLASAAELIPPLAPFGSSLRHLADDDCITP